MISADYGTNKTYLGRSSSVNQVYVSSSVSYESPSGFFAGIEAYRLLQPRNRWEEFDIHAGWDFFLFRKSVEASASYSHSGYGKQSQQITSSLNNNLEFTLGKNFRVVKSKLFLDFDFGNGSKDFSIALDESHDFVFENLFAEEDQLKVKPLISLGAGTLNFYRLYLKKPSEKPSLQNLAATIDTKFALTGIEFSLPLEYDLGRFSFEPAVHYNIPLNQPKRFNSTPVTYFTVSLAYAII